MNHQNPLFEKQSKVIKLLRCANIVNSLNQS